jgi:uncharacterized protein
MRSAMIVDCHAHIFPDHVAERAMEVLAACYGAAPVVLPTRDNLLRHMDQCGVDRAVAVSVATRPAQVAGINAWLMGLGSERLIPFGALHPHYEDIPDEVERLLEAGVRGIKLQPHFQAYDIVEPQFARMLEVVGDRLVVLLHGGQELIPIEHVVPTPARVAALARQFPQVRFILAHLGASGMWDEVEQHLVGQDVWFDASYVFGFCPPEQILRIIRNHGPGRIVWGSDFPWQGQAVGLEGVRSLGLSEAETAGILGGNLLKLLGLKA